MQSLESDDEGEQFLGKVDAIKEQHGGSAYAAMASLAEARFHVEKITFRVLSQHCAGLLIRAALQNFDQPHACDWRGY